MSDDHCLASDSDRGQAAMFTVARVALVWVWHESYSVHKMPVNRIN